MVVCLRGKLLGFPFCFCYIFLYLCEANSNMKRYKVRQVLRLLKKDGWVINRTKGDVLGQELLNSIWKQAGWK